MVGPGALGVLGDVYAVQPRLVALDVDEPVDQRCAALAQRLHLGPHEHEPRLEDVLEVVVVAGAPVRRDQLAPDSFGIRTVSQADSNSALTSTSADRPACRSPSP